MSNDIKFINGLSFKAPHENAPEYVKAKGWIKRLELIAWLQSETDDSINFDVKVSQGGKWYAAVDNWKPQEGNTASASSRGGAPNRERPQRATEPQGDDADPFKDQIPFVTNRSRF